MSTDQLTRRQELFESLGDVQERIARAAHVAGRAAHDINLIGVTKTYPSSDAEILYHLGLRDFAENRESEGATKSDLIAPDISQKIRWHFQGKIQSNKIKSLLTWADVIQSVDDIRHIPLLAKNLPQGKRLDLFLQVCLDPQPGRGGAQPADLSALADAVSQFDGLHLRGLMAVGPLSEDPQSAFSRLARIHADFKGKFPAAPELSAGMSSDFEVAILYGATLVRIGSSILGSRH